MAHIGSGISPAGSSHKIVAMDGVTDTTQPNTHAQHRRGADGLLPPTAAQRNTAVIRIPIGSEM